jgi:hypothetical protein
MKFNWFCGFGRMFGMLGLFYGLMLRLHCGSGLPRSTEEWVAESFVGFLFVSAAAFYAVGKHFVGVK